MSNGYYQEPLGLLQEAYAANDPKQKQFFINKAMEMYKNPQFEINQNRNTINNTLSNNNSSNMLQTNIMGGPAATQKGCWGPWGPRMAHMGGSSPPAP
jgi:hypothetical protein